MFGDKGDLLKAKQKILPRVQAQTVRSSLVILLAGLLSPGKFVLFTQGLALSMPSRQDLAHDYNYDYNSRGLFLVIVHRVFSLCKVSTI